MVRADLASFSTTSFMSLSAFAERAAMSADDVAFLFHSGALSLPAVAGDVEAAAAGAGSGQPLLAIPLSAVDSLLLALDERSVLVPLSDLVDEVSGAIDEVVLTTTALNAGMRCMLRSGRSFLTPVAFAQLRELVGL